MSMLFSLPMRAVLGFILVQYVTVESTMVTIHNDRPLTAIDGSYVDAHDGMILHHQGTYYLYGEAYGNQTLATQYPWPKHPRLAVYTSPDMVNWTYRGPVLNEAQVSGTLWIPNVIYHEASKRFILWFGAGGATNPNPNPKPYPNPKPNPNPGA